MEIIDILSAKAVSKLGHHRDNSSQEAGNRSPAGRPERGDEEIAKATTRKHAVRADVDTARFKWREKDKEE
ncbi:hypothetical protein NE852_21270 [Rhizobium sp. Pop5]|uniref:hypothetical protein n=1 Tax=Rhizobium sp. Pop5 TaxID=1223565 RepID=UPI000AEFEC64|nr:hypothetical protein [Rhizobium sp. Pop5]UVD56568.1 hypothetical protein NE852_21270 [Rhizobium sp. Pop5]